jgi:hypothetical protein
LVYRFEWHHLSEFTGTSRATITWDISADTPPGRYRIQHFGDWKSIGGTITAFSGSSKEFQVVTSRMAKVKLLNKKLLKTKLRLLSNDVRDSKFSGHGKLGKKLLAHKIRQG